MFRPFSASFPESTVYELTVDPSCLLQGIAYLSVDRATVEIRLQIRLGLSLAIVQMACTVVMV